ncbi:MAG TPA: tRNA uridine-5-carboxymethylaminomethyl(34) synthesis enzyme MnmG, partial [Kiloniellales bacterium]|nr:tRNA uridine-5-carboxymethylaminomethyl(34) synthesis enzyme MnmG [Kiloniellales bacterium]
EAYIGVLVDDLVTRGVSEPYRMFTSRAEFRLRLRADNADRRLTGRGLAIGCVGPERAEAFAAEMAALEAGRSLLDSLSATPDQLARAGIAVNRDGQRRTAFDLLRLPDLALTRLQQVWPELREIPPRAGARLEIEARYATYIERQDADVRAFRKDEALRLPGGLDYAAIPGLSTEVREALGRARPATLGAAARIQGMTPAAIVALLRHVRRDARASAA